MTSVPKLLFRQVFAHRNGKVSYGRRARGHSGRSACQLCPISICELSLPVSMIVGQEEPFSSPQSLWACDPSLSSRPPHLAKRSSQLM